MMSKLAVFVGACALATAGVASADYTGATVMNLGEILPGTTTYQIFVNFSSPDDRLLAISGNDGVSALRYSGAELVQNAPGFEHLDIQDRLFVGSQPGDSYVTIGGSFDTAFSPGFLDPEFPGASVIKGSFFEQLDNGGYFDFDPGTAENGGSVLIAQFTITSGTTASYEATVDHVLAGQSGVTSVAMGTVVIPAPGVTALLGLAGLAGTRRRRVVAVRR
ncbi:MAG: hypothetical protein ACYTEV_11590 [Planctomycetota bacterium]|jgi:hypothetical protein